MINRIKAFKRICVMAACAAITVSCATAPSSGSQTGSAASQAEIDSRQRIYMAYLREAGYTPTINDNGYIVFPREGINYYLYIDDTDPTFCFLQIPNIRYLNSDDERRRGAAAVSIANGGTKVAKAYFVNSESRWWVSIGTEVYLENPDHFAVIFRRMMSAANTAKELFDNNF